MTEEQARELLKSKAGQGGAPGSEYNRRRALLNTMYKAYNNQPPEWQEYLRLLLERDKLTRADDNLRDNFTETHNAFVLRYLTPGTAMHPTRVADQFSVDVRTVYSWFNKTLDRLMICAFGLDGLKM